MDLRQARTEEAVRAVRTRPVGTSLQHYASPYYDPVKAKEYYERTKKLKGERDANKLTSEQQDVYNVSRDEMAKAKQKEVDAASDTFSAKVEELRARSEATVRAFADKLRNLSVTKDLPLNPIPRNATPGQRALLMRENERIRQKAKKDAVAERKKIGDGLRQELSKAREAYQTSMASIKDKYEQADNTERANIREQVKSTPKPKKK
jgi:hypothetical protein